MQEKKLPSLHYYFAFRVLPDLVLNNFELFMKLVGAGAESFAQLLIDQWNGILADNPDSFVNTELPEEDPFAFRIISDENDPPAHPILFLIAMPPARNIPEAAVVAVAIYEKHARIFMMEISTSVLTGEFCYVVGEQTLEEHLNYGQVKNYDEFIAKITELTAFS